MKKIELVCMVVMALIIGVAGLTGCGSDDEYPLRFDTSGKYTALRGGNLLSDCGELATLTLTQDTTEGTWSDLFGIDNNGTTYYGQVEGENDTTVEFWLTAVDIDRVKITIDGEIFMTADGVLQIVAEWERGSCEAIMTGYRR